VIIVARWLARRTRSSAPTIDFLAPTARTITPAKVLSQIGSPFAPDQQPPVEEELNHAA
jgi:hypothetical protein